MTEKEIPSELNLQNDNIVLHDKTVALIEEMFDTIKSDTFFCETFREKTVYKDSCITCSKSEGCSQVKKRETTFEVLEWLLDTNEENQ